MPGRYAIVHSPEHRLWMDEFLAFVKSREIADVFREGVRRYAKEVGFREPPKL